MEINFKVIGGDIFVGGLEGNFAGLWGQTPIEDRTINE